MEDVLVVLVVHGSDCECDERSESSNLKVNSNAYRQGWEQIFGSTEKPASQRLH
jgi:hypothetical protein